MRSCSMTDQPRRLGRLSGVAVWLALLLLCHVVGARPAIAQATDPLTIGYVEIAGDGRYAPVRGAERMVVATRERPFPAVQVALDEAKPLSTVIHRDFAVARITADSADDVAPAVLTALHEQNIHFFVLDLPGEAIRLLAQAMHGQDVLLFNATAPDDWLRRETCSAEIVHTAPSLAMTTDALAQYLVFRKWRDVLVLQGPRPGDAVLADAFVQSVKKFGARIADRVAFKLGNDPRDREQNDIALLTATNRDYDVVFVADTDPDLEFSRMVPYRTTRPRPVIGSVGLTADAWNWTWERYGAPQLINRFTAKAGRHMTGLDWSAWMAAKLVITAALRTRGGDFARLAPQILSDASYDGVKGLAVSVRPWDHQLRQAILLSTRDAVVASAPLPGFLHATNELDTLGDDQPETPCHLGGG
jgi:ABC transporter substrate binding protein (PQQ-dependent alcohol dehydrogenase system)